MVASGLRKAFHVGGNSSCRQHLRQHWELYKNKCEEKNIPINHWAIPRAVLKNMEADKLDAENAEMAQSKLGFKKVTVPREFTREGILEAVVKLIATDDQVRSKWSKNLSAYLTLLVVGIGRQTCVSELSRCDATKNDDKGPPKHA